MTHFRNLLLWLAMLLPAGISANPEAAPMLTREPGDHALTFSSTFDKSEQPFRLYLPSAIKSDGALPMVVVLHGKYVDQNTWFDNTPIKEAAEKHGYIAAAPHGRGNWFYRGPGEQDVFDIVDLLKAQYTIDENRIYLMGHSMGGCGTWWLAARRPDVFATICPMAAMAPHDLMGNMAPLDPLIIHSGDDDVVPVSGGREAAHWLAERGISFRYVEESGYGHSSTLIGDNFDRIFAWFAAHRRDPKPATVSYTTRRAPSGAWWIRVLQTSSSPGLASIRAECKDGKELIITADNVERFALLADRLPDGIVWPATLRLNGMTRALDRFDGAAEIGPLSAGSQFKIAVKSADALEPKSSPVIGTLAADFPTTEGGLTHVAPVAALLKREGRADYALLHRDMFRLLMVAPLTEAALLDLYIYPDDSLVTFPLSGAELIEMEKSESALFAIGPLEPTPNPNRTYTVVAPFFMARRFNVNFTPLPKRIGEYVVEHVKRTGQWP